MKDRIIIVQKWHYAVVEVPVPIPMPMACPWVGIPPEVSQAEQWSAMTEDYPEPKCDSKLPVTQPDCKEFAAGLRPAVTTPRARINVRHIGDQLAKTSAVGGL